MFLQIESYTEQPYVHVNLVLSEMPESLVMHVFLHLSKRSFWLYRSLTPVLHTFLLTSTAKMLPFYMHSTYGLHIWFCYPWLSCKDSQVDSLHIAALYIM